jgi:hypothetical protein
MTPCSRYWNCILQYLTAGFGREVLDQDSSTVLLQPQSYNSGRKGVIRKRSVGVHPAVEWPLAETCDSRNKISTYKNPRSAGLYSAIVQPLAEMCGNGKV